MIPFRLMFNPASLFREYPRREWRRITLWLKWGLLFSFFGLFLKVLIVDDPAAVSSVMRFLKYLSAESETQIPRFINFSLFAITKATYLVILWFLRGLIIFIGMKMIARSFVELPVALSIAGASMVAGFWYWLPYGYWFYAIHSVFLISFLMVNINRTRYYKAGLIGFVSGILPLLF
ncbi:MAG: hypothetical protein ACQEP7_07410 [bacterium]